MDSKILVSDFMDRAPAVVPEGTPLTAVIDVLAGHHQTGAPVVNDKREVVGFVSEQDCMRQLLLSSYHCSLEPSVNEVMRTDVVAVTPKDTVMSVAQQMIDQKPKLYPVIDGGKLVGLIGRAAVLQVLKENESLCHRKPTKS